MACRFLLGLGYPGAYLAAAKAASEWYPPQERALVTGLYTAGATIGATVAPPLVAWLALSFGWQYAFFVPGVIGLVYVLLWLLVYRDPAKHPLLSDAERRYIFSSRPLRQTATPPIRESLPFLLQNRYFWAVFLGRMLGDPPLIFYVYWMPKFLNETQGLDLRAIGLVAWIPFLFADIGSLAGGWLSGRFVRRGLDPVTARLRVMAGCATLSIFAFTIHFTHSTALTVALMSVMTLATMGWMVNLSTVPVDVFPTEIVSTSVGLTTAGVILGQLAFTYMIGHIVERYSYGPIFLLMSLMSPAAYVLVRLILRPALQPALRGEAS